MTPTPEGLTHTAGLVAAAKNSIDAHTKNLERLDWRPGRAHYEGDRNFIDRLAAAIETLQAERDEARQGGEDALQIAIKWQARAEAAEAAEAELAALRARVEEAEKRVERARLVYESMGPSAIKADLGRALNQAPISLQPKIDLATIQPKGEEG